MENRVDLSVLISNLIKEIEKDEVWKYSGNTAVFFNEIVDFVNRLILTPGQKSDILLIIKNHIGLKKILPSISLYHNDL